MRRRKGTHRKGEGHGGDGRGGRTDCHLHGTERERERERSGKDIQWIQTLVFHKKQKLLHSTL